MSDLFFSYIRLSQKFTFIQGPPGTGKTRTIVAITKSFIDAGIKPVLIVGHSNLTADFCCQELRHINVGRVLSLQIEDAIVAAKANEIDSEYDHPIPGFNRSDYSIHRKAVDAYNNKNGIEAGTYPNMRRMKVYRELKDIEQKLIMDKDAICVTSSTSGAARLDTLKNTKLRFPVVIFDEAGQCIDPDFLISLCHFPERMILVGDTFQLGPLILNRSAEQCGLGVNILTKLLKQEIAPNLLVHQYRMHPALLEFPSKYFYHDLVKSGIKADARIFAYPKGKMFKFPNPEKPLMFWDVDGKESVGSDGNSFVNLVQADAVSKALDALHEAGIPPESIGIITAYNGQNDFLMDNLGEICSVCGEKFINRVEIATVDGFQGREKDFIIFNLVRSNPDFNIGFLVRKERLNVSITRARYGLIVIGSARTFSGCQMYCDWMKYFVDNNCFIRGDDFTCLYPSSFTSHVGEKERKEQERAQRQCENKK
ncbi:regulator of nonsense transcripts 1, putative [Trichomonas vaginalis G3]|uniref:Regulator of nonsense transcripts 1, putative n=1 Tax=Trichomonas vaginalis (strain ATCC PRA-98 / G3) TaxID=412133 RepID=A2DCY4_TRIV3|nr:nuclear-transcribed mRNA catabolic process, nonsense-mediated decay [Trichomonas vaginalis G3]EAY21758.1 regulator of nonsense transcripts 1, putative [Trichomonas vaginalis G3]KAI5524267.1 nuclear-transcribed mRNA catabolic process, nonsense-mediated decay [Trichomonas vaginalis G3]|eukprot:XP_001582744.1 regulator of nonsense transcripts 1 [Trichomonas vaginalis G3]